MIRGSELDPGLCALWSAIQTANPQLANPYFRPEFTEAVAAVRDDVWVGVLHESGSVRGFFPFQRRGRRGLPVGGGRSNFQGVIVPADLSFDPLHLITGCQLDEWKFSHLLVSQQAFAPYCRALASAPHIDLRDGWDAYAATRRDNGSQPTRRRQARKLAREIGPLRFVPHDPDVTTLHQLMEWKSAQYRRTGQLDRFAHRWNRELLERIQGVQQDGFAGMCSALWAGDRLAAVNMSMTSGTTNHGWFMAYDTELGRYSPGLVLLSELLQAASGLGLSRFELGAGNEPYKDRLKTGETLIALGTVAVPSLGRRTRRLGANALAKTPPSLRRRVRRLGANALAKTSFGAPVRNAVRIILRREV